MLNLDPRTTTLVLIDLQKAIVGRSLSPHSGADVVAASGKLADNFRQAGAPVVLVNVSFAKDFGNAPGNNVDQPTPRPPGGYPDDFSELAEGLAQPGDIRVTKRQWGAFYGTDLDVQMRRRGIKTIVLGGIATNFGVESSAIQAWERGYDVVVVEDATSSMSAEMHAFSITSMLPRVSLIVKTGDIQLKID
jgi:nicotinamidase-related amidase